MAGGAQADFVRRNDTCSNQTVVAGASCSFEVVFTPGAVGARTATLSVPSSDPGQSTLTVALKGAGTVIAALALDLSAIADRIWVDDLSQFPDWGTVQIDDEVISYKDKKVAGAVTGAGAAAAGQPGYLLIGRRGLNQTTPAAHSAGATVVLVPSTVCAGDCNGDGRVTIDALVQGVNLVLGLPTVDGWLAFDGDGEGAANKRTLIGALNASLSGCVEQGMPARPHETTGKASLQTPLGAHGFRCMSAHERAVRGVRWPPWRGDAPQAAPGAGLDSARPWATGTRRYPSGGPGGERRCSRRLHAALQHARPCDLIEGEERR